MKKISRTKIDPQELTKQALFEDISKYLKGYNLTYERVQFTITIDNDSDQVINVMIDEGE